MYGIYDKQSAPHSNRQKQFNQSSCKKPTYFTTTTTITFADGFGRVDDHGVFDQRFQRF